MAGQLNEGGCEANITLRPPVASPPFSLLSSRRSAVLFCSVLLSSKGTLMTPSSLKMVEY